MTVNITTSWYAAVTEWLRRGYTAITAPGIPSGTTIPRTIPFTIGS